MVPNDNAELATIVLLHYNSPKVAARLKQFIATELKGRDPTEMLPEADVLRAWCHMVALYQVKEAIPTLAQMALCANAQNEEVENGGQKNWWSSHSEAVATLAGLTGQKPEDFNVQKSTFKTEGGEGAPPQNGLAGTHPRKKPSKPW